MKKAFGYALALTIGLAAGSVLSTNVSAHTPPPRAAAVQHGTDAAYRDGLFEGKYDAAQGRLRHVSTGRWSTSLDRSQYQAGYDAGFGTAK
jgi:uncharacterized protein with FMN-binding domain